MATIGRRRARRTPRSGASRTAGVRGAGATDVGHARDVNQDVIVVEPDLGLYIVLDGMGGRNAGEVAARLAGERVVDYVRQEARVLRRWPRRVIERAFDAATEALYLAGLQLEQRRGMGTTAVACLVVDPTLAVIAHVGDSRAYLLRDGELVQLTRDHSLVQELVDQGKLSPAGARRSSQRHVITRKLGHFSVRTDVQERTLEPGDRLLLCSDGLHGYTPERSIRRVLASRGDPAQLAHELVALALRGRAPDNVSAVVIAVDGAPSGERPRSPRRPARVARVAGPKKTTRR